MDKIMSQPGGERYDDRSDDEIFFGKLTLKEIKKHIFLNHGQIHNFDTVHHDNTTQDNNTSLKLIETHSQPNLRPTVVYSPKFHSVPGSPVINNRKSEDSFTLIEKKVSQLCSSGNAESLELNNTLEIVDYILKNGPNSNQTDYEKFSSIEHNNMSPLASKVGFKNITSPRQELAKKQVNEINVKTCPKYVGEMSIKNSPKCHHEINVKKTSKYHDKINVKNTPKYHDEINVKNTPSCNDEIDVKNSPKYHDKINVKNSPKYHDERNVKNPPKYHDEINVKNTPKCHDERNVKNSPEYHDEINVKNTPIFHAKINVKNSPKYRDEINANNCSKYFTPPKTVKMKQCETFSTPSSVNLNCKTSLFKTPAPATSQKKRLMPSPRRTPNKSNAYQHIASPIASYIRNCPQNLVVKDVPPRKDLPSSIPKYVVHPSASKTHNKENISLNPVAYKSAKKTKVITMPNDEKLPKSQWVKKISSHVPVATVMKHEKREMKPKLPLLSKQNGNEDNSNASFSNLSGVQAEVSICTKKTAFNTKRF